jgi:hypothetical protein
MRTVINKIPDPNDPRHGTSNGYSNLGCRCPDCTQAWREYHYKWMRAKPYRLRDHAHRARLRRVPARQAKRAK